MATRTDADREALLARIAELERDSVRLRREAEDTAEANVRAALHLVELHSDRERELEQKNAEIAAALGRAEEASRQKSRFLANMSHELRTPLSGIRGMADLLRDSALSDTQRDYVDAIGRTADGFLELVNQLLDFAKIEAGRVELEHIVFDLWELIEDTAQHLQVGCDQKGLAFSFELDAAVPRRISGDPLRLRQVLHNLGSNAVKFTSGGRVTLRAINQGSVAQPILEVAIVDTGCGIPDDVAARLFEPFVQADASTTRRFGGTGLGLVICRHLAHRMGGELAFTSQAGCGTTFTLCLPIEPASCSVPSATVIGRAVVVADAPATVSMLCSHLTAGGFDVVLRRDVEQAGAEHADLLVVDCAADGGEVRDYLRRHPLPGRRNVLLVDAGAALGGESAADFLVLERPLRPTRLLHALELASGQAVAAARGDLPTAPGSDVAGLRVLVAEDTPVNRRVVTAQLQRLGCTVECVDDGDAAVAALRRTTFDAVLMDCHMPRLDGYAATRAIRIDEQSRGGRTPIIALTANALAGHREHCLECGMDGHLVKPVSKKELEAVLREHCRR